MKAVLGDKNFSRASFVLCVLCSIALNMILLNNSTFAQNQIFAEDNFKENVRLPVLLKDNNYKEKMSLINGINSFSFNKLLKSAEAKFELDTIFTQTWDEEGQRLLNSIRYNYDFEEENNLVNVRMYAWNDKEEGWRISDHIIYEFNENDQLIQAEFRHYIGFLYFTFARIDYEYSEDRLTTETNFEKIDEEDDWELLGRTFYVYDSVGNIESATKEEWENYDAIWIPENRTSFEYDSVINLIREAYLEYDSYLLEWNEKGQIIFDYDSLQRRILKTEFVSGSGEGEYIEDKKLEWFYSDEGELLSDIFSSYDYDADKFLPEIKNSYSDTVDDKLYEKRTFSWNLQLAEWELHKRTDYLSIQNLNENDVLYPEFIQVHFPVYLFEQELCEKIEEFTLIEGSWINTSNTHYVFTDPLKTGVSEQLTLTIMVYPNPVRDILRIQARNSQLIKCVITDLEGRTLQISEYNNQHEFDLSPLQSGVLILSMYERDGRTLRKKILKF